jgi:hypothetical protein
MHGEIWQKQMAMERKPTLRGFLSVLSETWRFLFILQEV